MLTPPTPRDPDFLARLAELAPDCCPVVAYGALRAARRARRARARLGQPALLAAAGLARCRPGAAGPDGRRRRHRRHDLRASRRASTPARCSARSPRRCGPTTPPAPCSTGWPHAGAGLLVATMDGLADGSLHAVPQPAEGVSLAPKLSTEEARVRWGLPAHVVDRHVRGCTPAPGAWTTFRGERVKVGPVRVVRPACGARGRRPVRCDPGDGGATGLLGWPPASCTSPSTRCSSARPPRRSSSARCARTARSRWPRPTGPAVSGSHRGSASMAEHDNRGGGRPARPRPRQRSVTAPSERTRRAEPTRFAAYTLLRAVDDGSYANLEMPAILRRHRLEGRDAAFATELALRHHPVAGLLRRRHRRGGRPPDRPHRPAGARRAAPRRAPAARDAGGHPRRRRPDRRAWPRWWPGPARAGSSTP